MDETQLDQQVTLALQDGIKRLNTGDPLVRGELLNIACGHLRRLTVSIREDLRPADPTIDEISVDSLFEAGESRLYLALHDSVIHDSRHFFQLASFHIRRELIEMCQSRTGELTPQLAQLVAFHRSVDRLPGPQREVFELIWYHEVPRDQVAQLLALTKLQVQRLWRSARLGLYELLEETA